MHAWVRPFWSLIFIQEKEMEFGGYPWPTGRQVNVFESGIISKSNPCFGSEKWTIGNCKGIFLAAEIFISRIVFLGVRAADRYHSVVD